MAGVKSSWKEINARAIISGNTVYSFDSCVITHIHWSRVRCTVTSQGHVDYWHEAWGHLRVVACNYVSVVL